MPLLSLARVLVIASTLLAVVAGLWPLASQPAVAGALGLLFAGAALAARRVPAMASAIVLAFAYVYYGVARLLVGAELAAMPFWLAAFAGLAVGAGSWSTWEARAGWRVPLAWWATSVAVTWPFFAARDLGYSLAPSLAAGPVVVAAATQMSLALWMDRLLVADASGGQPARSRITLPAWAWPLAASAIVTAAAAMYQRFIDPAWLSGEPWISARRSVGMMGDANPTGFAAALWAPLVWMMIAGTGVVGTVAGGAVAVLLWTAAWASGARTSIILLGAGLAGLALVAARVVALPRRTMLGAAAAAGLLVGLLAVVAVPRATPESPIGRFVATVPAASPGTALYELLWRRDGYGLAAVEAIKEHPVIGVGVGRFPGVSTEYFHRVSGRTIPPDNAQNFWRHTLAEQGIVGLLPALWLTALVVRGLVSRSSTNLGLLMRVMLAGLGVALVFGYPLQDAAIAVTVGTLAAAVERDRTAARHSDG